MSGICGVINSGLVDETLHEKTVNMTQTLAHRGQDAEIIYTSEESGFGVRILNVFDQPVHKKPITNEDRTVYVFADCEIYNFLNLKTELEKKGHKFTSNTDAEVIVHLYEDFGEQCVHSLRGVFSFAIWDTKLKKLLLYRDRLGARPVFYAQSGNVFVFGSEMKAIFDFGLVNKELNYNALDYFLT